MEKLNLEIIRVREILYMFTATAAYDSGVRLAEKEAYLLGLECAYRWVRKELKGKKRAED